MAGGGVGVYGGVSNPGKGFPPTLIDNPGLSFMRSSSFAGAARLGPGDTVPGLTGARFTSFGDWNIRNGFRTVNNKN